MHSENERQDLEQIKQEYDICLSRSQQLESNIWISSSLMGIGSTLPIIIALFSDKIGVFSFCIIGLMVISINLIWFFISRRWWTLQHIVFLRMRHLEQKLNYKINSYIAHFDGSINLSADASLSEIELLQLNQFNKNSNHLSGVYKWIRIYPFIIATAIMEYGFYLYYRCLFQKTAFIIIVFPYLLIFGINSICTRCKSKENTKRIKGRKT